MDLIWFKYGIKKYVFFLLYQNMGLVRVKYGFRTAWYGLNMVLGIF